MSAPGPSRNRGGSVAGSVLLTLLLSSALPVLAEEALVLEIVPAAGAAAWAGLRPGDRVVGWERKSQAPQSPTAARGVIVDIYDYLLVRAEQTPRGSITLLVERESVSLRFQMEQAEWFLLGRPDLPEPALGLYLRGQVAASQGRLEEADGSWAEVEDRLVAAGWHRKAVWMAEWRARLRHRQGDLLGTADRQKEAVGHATKSGEESVEGLERVFLAQTLFELALEQEGRSELEKARQVAERRDPSGLWLSNILLYQATRELQLADAAPAEPLLRKALELREAAAPGHWICAEPLTWLGYAARLQGRLEEAQQLLWRARRLVEPVAGESELMGTIYFHLGSVELERSDLATAEVDLRRALALRTRYQPGSLGEAAARLHLSLALQRRGRLAEAEALLLPALTAWLEHGQLPAAAIEGLLNLGNLAFERGDHETARRHWSHVLQGLEGDEGEQELAALALVSLGELAVRERRFDEASELFDRALSKVRGQSSGSSEEASALDGLASLRAAQGRADESDRLSAEAQRILEARGVEGPDLAAVLAHRAEAALARRDLALAEGLASRSLAVRMRLAPGSQWEAESAALLAQVLVAEGRWVEARSRFEQAISALDYQRRSWGGRLAQRYQLGARSTEIYRRLVDLLVSLGEREAAFQVLERMRSRTFLALLAEREVVLDAFVPVELDRERRLADAEYDRLWADLARAGSVEKAALDLRREALSAARHRREQVRARIQAIAPSLAWLTQPQTLDARAVSQLLEDGDVLLAYSLGEQHHHLFVVGREPASLSVLSLEMGEPPLAEEVRKLRTLIAEGGPTEAVVQVSSRLADRLLGPAVEKIGSCRRLIVVPDGPLHDLPFSALMDPTSPPGAPHYLIERLAVHKVASATVLAELVARRRAEPGSFSLVAFGDPAYPTDSSGPETEVQLAAAVRSGLSLSPLPGSRAEVEALARLFPGEVKVWTGSEASEEKVKSLGRGPRFLHFACHGFVDEPSPLESGLALSIPARPEKGENGYLQAWEILEQMRIDAELVTLSACETARGADLGGEGILGLSRAFQHAGAASVLASLWAVGDASTAALMVRFYSGLKAGLGKAEALRQAQLALLRGEEGSVASHPFAWAGFELLGDGR